MSELKQRGRKNFTEKQPQTTTIETNITMSNHHACPERPEVANKPMSLQMKMLVLLGACCVVSAGAMVAFYLQKQTRGKNTFFGTRKSRQRAGNDDKRKRNAPNAMLARSKPEPWDRDNSGGGGVNHKAQNNDFYYSPYDGDEGDEDDEDEYDEAYLPDGNDEQKYNLAPFLAPMLRGALFENNKANLNIHSDQFVHGDDDDQPNDEERKQRELLKRQEETLANRDVPLAADLDRVAKLREKLAAKLQFAKQPKVKVLNDINATEFYIAVGQSEPVLVTNASQWCTQHNWTLDFIRSKAGDSIVGIETSKSNRFYSNEGLKRKQMKVSEFLDVFTSPTRPMDYYLAEEGLEKMPELEQDLNIENMDFANFAVLDRKQLWVGAGGQVSPLHHDQWDNILCQVQGRRTFYLYDPLQVDRLYPKSGAERHFSQVDPSKPDFVKFPKFKYARQYRVDVEAGQMIILPAYWWHQVHHGPDVNVGVNYWFVPASLMSELLYDVMLPDGPNY